MNKKPYSSVPVNQVRVVDLLRGRERQTVTVGVDMGKYTLFAVVRWSDGALERPWRVENPAELGTFVAVLRELAQCQDVVVALEPTGTYGDPLRRSLGEAGLGVQRVSPKAAHDYAEVFDGVPSQHDGKDAAVVAELCAIGKAKAWAYEPPSAVDEELAYWVERLDRERRLEQMHGGPLEGLLARHWPEATQWIRLRSGTLLRALEKYGTAAALAADPQARPQLKKWGGARLNDTVVDGLLASAAASCGVPPGAWERRQIQDQARSVLAARRAGDRCSRRLQALAADQPVLTAQGGVVGVPTACVLWHYLGDPRHYDSAAAYRKAMGLNLAERSSGVYQGRLKISKRGPRRVRRWLYLAALRLLRREPTLLPWYRRHREDNRRRGVRCPGKQAVVAVMRKLALALHRVGATGVPFSITRLLAGGARPASRPGRRTQKLTQGG
jgi:transposase